MNEAKAALSDDDFNKAKNRLVDETRKGRAGAKVWIQVLVPDDPELPGNREGRDVVVRAATAIIKKVLGGKSENVRVVTHQRREGFSMSEADYADLVGRLNALHGNVREQLSL